MWPPHQLSTVQTRVSTAQHIARTNLGPILYIYSTVTTMKLLSVFTRVFAASILQTVTAGTRDGV